MHSTKCPKCGLVYLSTASNCKNCGTETQAPEQFDYLKVTTPVQVAVPMMAHAGKVSKIEVSRKEHLLNILKRDSFLFYYVGAALLVLSYFVSYVLIPDALLNIALGYVAYRFKSRAAAVALLGIAILVILAGVAWMIKDGPSLNLVTPLILIFRVIAGVRIVRTVFELKSLSTSEMAPMFAQ